jgi:hypothetical protein
VLKRVRTRMTYANVVASLALVFAMSGGAYAASRYIITSTKQIKPSVLSTLKGANGKAGANGATGAAGPTGPQGAAGSQGQAGGAGAKGEQGSPGEKGLQGEPGKEGPKGKEGSPWTAVGTLPPGKTETGAWTAQGQEPLVPISFTLPVEGKLTPHFIKAGEATPAGCEGKAGSAGAEPGDLCIFEGSLNEPLTSSEILDTAGSSTELTGVSHGAILALVYKSASGLGAGDWAVTAPLE